MSQNIEQIYIANPTTSMASTDLLYLGRSPYGVSDDFAITWSNMQLSITAVGVITAGTWSGSTIAVNKGGTGVTSVTTAPTATAFAGWDANSNLSANNFNAGFVSIPTAAATTTLTVASKRNQEFTGITTQTVAMPVTSTLAAGQEFYIINNSTGAVTVNSSGGNAIQILASGTSCLLTCVLTSGTTAASWESAYLADAGVAPPGASGTILRSSGTAWVASQSTFADTYGASTLLYSNGANTVTGLATGNNGVLITSAGGVPSISSTLPSGIAATNMVLTTPTLGVASSTSLTFSSTSGIIGTTTNNDAAAGSVGELVTSIIPEASPVSVTLTGTIQNFTSISLTAGDWDVWCNLTFIPNAGVTTIQYFTGWISSVSVGIPDASLYTTNIFPAATTTSAAPGLTVPSRRFSLSGTTTIYSSFVAGFGVSTLQVIGGLYARRRR